MRIVGGEARGRKLFAPEGLDTRPTADRVRESLFNILSPRVRGSRVLDLFAGSGALALEALSRGAFSAVLVDVSAKACQLIKRNIEIVRCEHATKLINADWKRALGQIGDGFDIVFFDPPYRMETVYAEAAQALLDAGLLNEGAVLVMEHWTKNALLLPAVFEVYDERHYGECAISLVRAQGSVGS